MEFSRQEYCSGLPFPSPGDLPNPRIEPGSSALQADSLPFELTGKPCCMKYNINSIHCLAKLMYSQSQKSYTNRVEGTIRGNTLKYHLCLSASFL